MRSAIRKKLVALFAHELQHRCPQFERTAQPHGTPPIWKWHIGNSLYFFILLQPFRHGDRFAVELAWSEDGSFPWGSIGQVEVSEPNGRERFPCWEGGKEKVWDLAPEATALLEAKLDAYARGESVPYSPSDPPIDQVLPRVKPLVDDAVQQLMQMGLPFLHRVAKHQGVP